MSFTRALVLRKFIPGPEDPSEMLSEGTAILKSRNWLFNLATGTAGGLSGLMFVFLAAVFFWRRPLVNRVSLRLIALISLFDLLYCILQAVPKVQDVTHLRCSLFFIDFSFGSIYLSSSIAFKLQMVFLRKSRAPLPRYVEYLYYAMPLSVCLLHIAPQYIYAATRGWTMNGQDTVSRTPKFLLLACLGILLIPYVFVLYNIITSLLVMYSLYTKQRVITRVLNSVSRETHSLLSGSNPNNAQDTLSAASASSPSISASPKERQQLKLARRVYRVSVRIALYPLAPTVGLILLSIFYLQQYFVTLKYKSDVNTYVWLTTVSYFMFPVIAFINFVIFLTDPAVLKVIAEVRHSIRFKMGRSDNFKSSGSGLHSPGRVVDKKASVTISESGVMSETMQADSSSLISTYDPEKTNSNYQPDGLFNTPGALEESRPFVSVIDMLQDDAIMRRMRASGDNESDYQDLL
ncbi:hypothetical protein GGH13_007669 [Coemansia sp. S155-1]|nr:hypothetical protein GGH13_007669 [Coemansia sp. S155-1]